MDKAPSSTEQLAAREELALIALNGWHDFTEAVDFINRKIRRLCLLNDSIRSESNRVPECISGLWVQILFDRNVCRIDLSGVNAIALALAGEIAIVNIGATREAVASFECRLLERSKFWEDLLPMRKSVVAAVKLKIRASACRNKLDPQHRASEATTPDET